jgi:hypothetical protein
MIVVLTKAKRKTKRAAFIACLGLASGKYVENANSREEKPTTTRGQTKATTKFQQEECLRKICEAPTGKMRS